MEMDPVSTKAKVLICGRVTLMMPVNKDMVCSLCQLGGFRICAIVL